MTHPIPKVSHMEEIKCGYKTLHQSVRRRLTDHYNL
jgi:hypothetical protein